MLPVKTILWPTDFSDNSMGALEHAMKLAKFFQAKLILAHVVPTIPVVHVPSSMTSFDVEDYREKLIQSKKEQLDEIGEERLAQEVAVENVVKYGNEAAGILKTASDYDADLIVMSTHGTSGFQRLVSGSVTDKVIRAATCPVLALPIR